VSDPALEAAIADFLVELRVERGLSPLTIAAYRRDLAQFAASAGTRWRDDPTPLIEFVAALQRRGAKGSTQARKSAAVRSFYAFALREGIASRDVPGLVDAPRAGSYLPDVLAPDDVVRILDAPPPDEPVGIRDRAILELLYDCGLRVSELVGLDIGRVDLEQLQVRVIGKGNRERRVPMGEEARERLHRYRSGPRQAWTARVRGQARPSHEPRGGVGAGQALDRGRRSDGARHAAHLSTQFRDAPARGWSRSASGPGAAGPC